MGNAGSQTRARMFSSKKFRKRLNVRAMRTPAAHVVRDLLNLLCAQEVAEDCAGLCVRLPDLEMAKVVTVRMYSGRVCRLVAIITNPASIV